MDSFQMLLLNVGRALCKEEFKALTFLCHDLLDRNPSALMSTNDLFTRLAERDHLSAERPELLTELLHQILRLDLIKKFKLHARAPISPIAPYRVMLYKLSEAMTADDLKDFKFLLTDKLPSGRLEERSTLDIFLELERQDLLSETKLEELERLSSSVCPKLKKMIDGYKEQQRNSVPPLPVEERGPSPRRDLNNEANYNEPMEDSVSLDAVGIPWTGVNRSVPAAQETSAITEELRVYSMTAAGRRGTCLIINNYNFTRRSGLNNREGTNLDKERLSAVFSWLGFHIVVRSNCSTEKMLSALQDLSAEDHAEADCVVVCILSHGLEGGVYGVDGGTVELAKLKEPLNGSNCRSLVGKPKLFFIQACQGDKEQMAVDLEADSDAYTAPFVRTIPSDADFLLAMATVPSYISFRSKTKGSWFIQSLYQNLVRMVPRGDDLISILTKVNADVSLKSTVDKTKQMPQPSFTLRKKVIFPVPEAPLPPPLPPLPSASRSLPHFCL